MVGVSAKTKALNARSAVNLTVGTTNTPTAASSPTSDYFVRPYKVVNRITTLILRKRYAINNGKTTK